MRLRLSVAVLAIGLLVLSTWTSGCDSKSNERNGSSTLVADPANGTILTATAGQPYSQTIAFSGWGTPPYTITAPNGTPAGLALSTGASSATLSGTPSTAGSGAFELQITDGTNRSQVLTYGFEVVKSTAPLSLSPTSLPAAISNVLYNQSLTISGGAQPFTWSITSGSLPTGLTLSSSTSASNAISGTAKTTGVFNFTITVTDSSSPAQTGNFPYTLTVN